MIGKFLTEDNQKLAFTTFGIMPKIGDKLKFNFHKNRDEVFEYEVIDAWHEVSEYSSNPSCPEINGVVVRLKLILA